MNIVKAMSLGDPVDGKILVSFTDEHDVPVMIGTGANRRPSSTYVDYEEWVNDPKMCVADIVATIYDDFETTASPPKPIDPITPISVQLSKSEAIDGVAAKVAIAEAIEAQKAAEAASVDVAGEGDSN